MQDILDSMNNSHNQLTEADTICIASQRNVMSGGVQPFPQTQYKDIEIRDSAKAHLGHTFISGVDRVIVNSKISRSLWRKNKRKLFRQSPFDCSQGSSSPRDPPRVLVDAFLVVTERLEQAQQHVAQGGLDPIQEMRFSNLSARLAAWGRACGLHDPSSYDTRLDFYDDKLKASIEGTLRIIAEQLTVQALQDKYGLPYCEKEDDSSGRSIGIRFGPPEFSSIRSCDAESRIQREVVDPTKFSLLLSDVRQFVEDLEAFTRDLQITKRICECLDKVAESISDTSVLTLIEDARISNNDPVSDAASIRLSKLRDGQASRVSIPAESPHNPKSWDNIDAAKDNDGSSTHSSFVSASTHQLNTGLVFPHHTHKAVDQASVVIMQQSQSSPHDPAVETPSNGSTSKQEFTKEELQAQQAKFSSLKQQDFTDSLVLIPDRKFTSLSKRVLRDIKDLARETTWPCTCSVIQDNLQDVLAAFLGPSDSPYEGGTFFLRMFLPPEYPYRPPVVKFLTRIYHPNIDPRGRVCCDILTVKDFSCALTLSTILLSIMSILDDPNVDDPLVPEIAQQYRDDRQEYNRIAREYTKKHATGDRPGLTPFDPNDRWWEGLAVETGSVPEQLSPVSKRIAELMDMNMDIDHISRELSRDFGWDIVEIVPGGGLNQSMEEVD